MLIAMVVHDLDHPGRTNHFLSNSQHELALLYNDKSILENHHVATAFKETTRSSASNIFKHLEAYVLYSMYVCMHVVCVCVFQLSRGGRQRFISTP